MNQFLLGVVTKCVSFFRVFIAQKTKMTNEFIHGSYYGQVTSNDELFKCLFTETGSVVFIILKIDMHEEGCDTIDN
jgi:uncharacterized protein (UPF0548 family)